MLSVFLTFCASGNGTAFLCDASSPDASNACYDTQFQLDAVASCIELSEKVCAKSCYVDGWECTLSCSVSAAIGVGLTANCIADFEKCTIRAQVTVLSWSGCTQSCDLYLPPWLIGIIVGGVVVVIILIVVCCCCCCGCCRSNPPPQTFAVPALPSLPTSGGFPQQYYAPIQLGAYPQYCGGYTQQPPGIGPNIQLPAGYAASSGAAYP
jgi:hypothetical protein